MHNRLCKLIFSIFFQVAEMGNGSVTLEQVAQAAGVSASTASRALAGKARECRISEKTEQAILNAAKGLGFRPSHVARSLRTQRTNLIGLLVPDASNPFFAAIARKATVSAERHGMSILLADSHDSIEHEKDLLAHLQSRQVEGFIMCPIGDCSLHLKKLEESRANVVVVDRWFHDVKLVTVTSENESGAYAGTDAIIAKGHREIGCLQGRPATSTNDERLRGFRRALEANHIQSNASFIRGDDFSENSGYRSTCELLDTHPEITALFALSNQNALGALRAFGERKLRVPHDISLITFDDAPFAEYLAAPLSVVRQDVAAIGACAAELLIEQIRSGTRQEELLHRVPVQLILRDSIGVPKALNGKVHRADSVAHSAGTV
jgi:LacI family transcriptional regulator